MKGYYTQTNAKFRILDDQYKIVEGATLYRIQAVKNFGNVKVGDVGGWIENEKNLSFLGNCWIFNEARVWGLPKLWEMHRLWVMPKFGVMQKFLMKHRSLEKLRFVGMLIFMVVL